MLRRAVTAAVAVVAVAAGLFAGTPAASAATATPIVYVMTATASGTLDGTSFTNAQVTVTQTTKTADVIDRNPEYYNSTGTGTGTVTVAGVGSDTLIYGTSFLDQYGFQPGNSAAFGFDGANLFKFVVLNPKLGSYDVRRPFGPVSGPTYVNPNRGARTSRGGLLLKTAGTATFKAYIP